MTQQDDFHSMTSPWRLKIDSDTVGHLSDGELLGKIMRSRPARGPLEVREWPLRGRKLLDLKP